MSQVRRPSTGLGGGGGCFPCSFADRAPVGWMAHQANLRRCWGADGGSALVPVGCLEPVSVRRWTDLEAELDRSRCGSGPISARGRVGRPGGSGWLGITTTHLGVVRGVGEDWVGWA